MAKGSGSAGRGGGGGAAAAPAAAAASGVAGAALANAPLPEFAGAVVSASLQVPTAQRWSSEKILISDAFAALQRQGATISLEQFKDRLLSANRSGALRLSRADAPMDARDRQRSQIEYLNATYHIIRLD